MKYLFRLIALPFFIAFVLISLFRDALILTDGAMSSSGLKTINFKFMTKLNRKQKLEYTTETAISYSTCYVSVIFLNFLCDGNRTI